MDQRRASGNSEVVSQGMLLGMIQGFASNPSATGRALREYADRTPQRFADSACLALREELPDAGRNFLIGILMERDVLLQALADPKVFSPEKALELSHIVHRSYPNMESQMLRLALQPMTSQGGKHVLPTDWERLRRVLEILGHIGNNMRVMPILSNFLRSGGSEVRLMAGPMLIQAFRSPLWLRELADDTDSRVQVTALEAYLAVTPVPDEMELLHKLAHNPNPKVSTTALLVLSHHGERDAVSQKLLEYCHHTESSFRSAAAAAMGKMGNSHFLPELQRMVREEQGEVKRMALLSCVALRKEQASSGNEAA